MIGGIFMNGNFSILDRYGEDFTQKEYVTNPAIGRDVQIDEWKDVKSCTCGTIKYEDLKP